MPGFEEADKLKPSSSRPSALHLQFYSSVSVWRGTEGGGVDAHRERHLEECILTCSNKREVEGGGGHLDFNIKVYVHYSTAQTGEERPESSNREKAGRGLLWFT